jgi:hypothetical protein
MEPNLVTDPKLSGVLEELARRETIFHRAEFGTARADFERMAEEAFWEVGASGRRYSREYVLDELERRRANPSEDDWQTGNFHRSEIAADNYLHTYTLIQGARHPALDHLAADGRGLEDRLSPGDDLERRLRLGWIVKVYRRGC